MAVKSPPKLTQKYGYECSSSRHGIYTNYVVKNDRVSLLIGGKTHKGLDPVYTVEAVTEFIVPDSFATTKNYRGNTVICTPDLQEYAYLSFDDIESLLIVNRC